MGSVTYHPSTLQLFTTQCDCSDLGEDEAFFSSDSDLVGTCDDYSGDGVIELGPVDLPGEPDGFLGEVECRELDLLVLWAVHDLDILTAPLGGSCDGLVEVEGRGLVLVSEQEGDVAAIGLAGDGEDSSEL